MFYQGNLQSGIALALQESKAVVCFVRDDGDASKRYEDEYLKDPQITLALSTKAVTLRLDSGSQEADFLAAYYPIHTVPTLMIIRNGQLTAEITQDTTAVNFKARVLTSLVSQPNETSTSERTIETQPASTSDSSSTHPERTNSEASSSQSTSVLTPEANQRPTAGSPSSTVNTGAVNIAPPESSSSSAVERLLQERRHRLEADKKEKDEAEKADRKAKAQARKEASAATADPAKAKQASYAQERRKQMHQAKLDRERVLRQIAQDRIDRKEREDRRKASLVQDDEDSTTPSSKDREAEKQDPAQQSTSKVTRNSGECAVQVRLYDGSTIRSKFLTSTTLKDIREWIDVRRSDDSPYTLKQILAPLPNRTLTISDESETLAELNFIPSATLVMIPVPGYTSAYDGASSGIIAKGVSVGYNALASGAGLVSGVVGTVLGFGRATPATDTPPQQGQVETTPPPEQSVPKSSTNVRTLRDQHGNNDERQFYNGNQLNFEPRNDNEKKDE